MVAIGVGLIIAAKTVLPAVIHSNSSLESFGGTFGTIVSAAFLFLIGLLNLVILGGIIRVFRSMRRGDYDEAELERQLENRGFFHRIFGRWMNTINKEWQMYPVGVVFGMGFDTATEVALLTTTALLASQKIPWQAIICLPVLFTAGMSLMDTTDGMFMNLAYGWAFFNPVRKVFYNLAITGLSVAICFFIGGIETLSLVPQDFPHSFSQTSGFWGFMYNFDINKAGFVIVGLFIITWALAIAIWRWGHIEERWTARLHGPAPDKWEGTGRRPPSEVANPTTPDRPAGPREREAGRSCGPGPGHQDGTWATGPTRACYGWQFVQWPVMVRRWGLTVNP